MNANESEERLNAAQMRAIDAICDRFEREWAGGAPTLDRFLQEAPPGCRRRLLIELAAVEMLCRRRAGQELPWDEFVAAHQPLVEELTACEAEVLETLIAEPAELHSNLTAQDPSPPLGLHIRCPHCCHPVELITDTPHEDVTCRECGSTFCLAEREPAGESTRPLQTIGRFELLARLGVGGFGTVWKARDPELDRVVAIKIPRRGQLRSEEAELFFREARAAAQLRHPHIVPVYELGKADDVIYIVSDLVNGITLADWMKTARPTLAESTAIAATIAEALHFAHERGIVHRDLKPSNVMIDSVGAPQIMDFGLAKRETGEVTMTVDGQILGTAAYMSPEQAAGQSHWTDRRADIYSLGVVLFQMATGELPFRGNLDAQLVSKLRDDPPDPRSLNPRVSPDLATICLKCLERDPNARYATAAAVADELQRTLRGEPIVARPIRRALRWWRWAKRRPALATALTLAAALAIGGPLAALTIDGQRRNLAKKNQELYALIESEQRAKGELSVTIAGLQSNLAAVRGDDAAEKLNGDSWRKALIAELLDKHLPAEMEQASTAALSMPQTGDVDATLRNLAMGMMLAEIGRDQLATEHLTAAHKLLDAFANAFPSQENYQLALADCCDQLVVLYNRLGDGRASQKFADQRLKIATQRAEVGPQDALRAVDLLAAHYQAIPEGGASPEIVTALAAVPSLTHRILDHWPRNADELYAAACRLTTRTPMLGKQATDLGIDTSDNVSSERER